ncbi:DUF5372 family protein [Actinophytocola glycyrrhizae]|uniref:DUF5372 family protein n=1 Tax=Actinophytocola glycyrrhizae TaxID=2044873 RepID=A0ABV9S8V7_9PSEU
MGYELHRTRSFVSRGSSLVVTHPFHPLCGRELPVLFERHTRRGLWFVCEVDGRRRVTLRQEWTDRGVPAADQRLASEGLTVLRAVIDALTGLSSSDTRVGE